MVLFHKPVGYHFKEDTFWPKAILCTAPYHAEKTQQYTNFYATQMASAWSPLSKQSTLHSTANVQSGIHRQQHFSHRAH